MSNNYGEHSESIRKRVCATEFDPIGLSRTDMFLKNLMELVLKYDAEFVHEFDDIILYVDEDEVEIGTVINNLSLNGLLKERNKK